MSELRIRTTKKVIDSEGCRRLAAAYDLILSLPDPIEKETASSGNFGEDTEQAVNSASTKESIANEV